MQLYAIKSVVEIDKVKLNIRFPGTLSFQFKNSLIYEDIPKFFPLVHGDCIVGENVALEVESLYNTQTDTFAEVTVDLIISINTVSGKIVAGTVSFNAVQNTNLTLPLKRCSDKTAEVSLNVAYARIEKIKDIEEESVAMKQKSESRLKINIKSREKRSVQKRTPVIILNEKKRETDRERNESKDSILVVSKIMKPINSLAADSRLKEMEENWQRKMKILNREKEELEGQLESVREKWKLSQRREKEMQTTLKDTRDQAEKRRIKVTDLQLKLNESEKALVQSDRKIKQLQLQAKLSQQRIEQSLAKYILLQKKSQGRQQSLGERQRRLAEKLSQLEVQHSRTVHEYNLLLQKMELQEKANQTIFKNKERTHLDQRAKWKETAQKYEKNTKKLQEDNDQLTSKLNALVSTESILRVKFAELQSNYQLLKNADEGRTFQIDRQESIKKELLSELDTYKRMQGDKAALKKKVNESTQQQLRVKQKLDKLTLQYEQSRQSIKNAERQIQQYKRDKKVANNRCSELQRTVTQNDKQIIKLSTEINNLSSKNTYLNQRLNDLKTKSDQQGASHFESQTQLQAKISSLFQSKQYLEADIEDLKWSLEKAEQSMTQWERKLKERSDEVFRYQEQKLKLTKEKQDLHLELEQSSNLIDSLKGELSDAKRRDHELQEGLKDREHKIYVHLKRISELQQEHFMASSKLNNNLEDYRDTLTNKESTIQQLNQQLSNKQAKVTELQSQLQILQEDCHEKAREIKLLTLSLDESDRSLKLQKEDNTQLKKANESLKRQLTETHSKMSSEQKDYVERIQTLTSSKLSLQKELQGKETDVETYKHSVQQLLMLVATSEQLIKIDEVIAVPDQALAKNQLQALQNRNKYLSAFKANIAELKVQITYLQKEVESKANSLADKNVELQINVKKHSQTILELESEWNRTAQNYTKHIEKLDTQLNKLRGEKERLQNKHKTLSELFQDEKIERQELQKQLSSTKSELKTHEELNLELRSRQISKKGEDESFIHNLKVELKAQLDKQQEKVEQLQKQIQNHLKTITDREKQISNLKSSLSSTEHEKSKVQSSLEQLQQKYAKLTEQKLNVDHNLTESNKRIASLKEDLQKVRVEVGSERQLKVALQQKLRQSHQHGSELSVDKENLQSRLDGIMKTSAFSQEEQKSRIAQLQEILQTQTKKSSKYFKQLTEKSGQLQLKEFLIKQLQQKLVQSQGTTNELRKELEQKRTTISKLTATIQDKNHTIISTEKERNDYSHQKSAVQNEVSLKKERISELEAEIKSLNQKLEKIGNELENSRMKEAELRDERNTLQSTVNELRESLTQSRKEGQRLSGSVSEGRTKVAILVQQLRQKQEFFQNHKSKNWQQNQREVNSLKEKAKQLEVKLENFNTEREDERETLKNEIQYLSHSNQELEELLQQKEEVIEQQEVELLEAQARIISLNGQLRSCLQAWEKEKSASLPARRQSAKIQQDLNKFQNYAADLDRKTKQMLNVAVLRAKDDAIAKNSQILIDLLQLMLKSKSRALGKATDGDKEQLIQQYDRMREKAEQLLKPQRIGQV